MLKRHNYYYKAPNFWYADDRSRRRRWNPETKNKVLRFFFLHDTLTNWKSSTTINVLAMGPEGTGIESS
jgi:hypothetical protein